MSYQPNAFYHIYNQGNNRERIFYQTRNYYFFIEKMEKHLPPYVDILAYCLMPNHFHILVRTKESACDLVLAKTTGEINNCRQVLSRQIGLMVSHYAKAINVQENRTGSIFRIKTKSKECWIDGFEATEIRKPEDYLTNCFHYIHNNPVKAKMVVNATDWVYSSAKDYAKLRNRTLCNQALAKALELI